MPGTNVFISSLLLSAVGACAQAPDYFPLDVGNVWIYRTVHGNEIVEVTRRGDFHGAPYFLVSGNWLRKDGEGRVFQYDERREVETLLYDFTKPAGERYLTGRGEVRVAATNGSRKIALGTFESALYQLQLAGEGEEGFLPYVGMVYGDGKELTYAKLSGVTVLNADGLGFGVAQAKGYVRMFLNNNTGAARRLVFRSGQTFELLVRDAADRVLYRWSEGKAFTQALRSGEFGPGETSWAVELPDLPGAATVTAELTTVGGGFTATIPLRSGSSSRP